LSFKETLEEKKKPIILVIAVVVLVIVLIVVFVPFGGNKQGTPPVMVITKKTIIQPPDAAKPVETAKMEAPETKSATGLESSAKKITVAPTASEKSVAAPVKTEAKASTMKETTKPWAVNTGSFSIRKEAEKFAKKLTDAGYENVYITEFKKDDINWHRVRVGFYSSKAEAIKVEGELSSKFNIDTPWAVRPSRGEVARHTK